MIDTNIDLSKRFFYVNPSAASTSDGARMFPMSRLIAMNMVADTELNLAFDDSGVGDHTIVKILITADKGREAIKDIVGAINSHQKVVVLADEYTGESIISDYKQERVGGVSVSITSGNAGTFALNGSFSVSGFANFNSLITYNYEDKDAGASGSAYALNTNLTISFVSTDTSKTHVTLASGSIGQIKYIIHKAISNGQNLVITPANFAAGTTLTSDSAGRGIALIFGPDSEWHVLGDVGEFAIA